MPSKILPIVVLMIVTLAAPRLQAQNAGFATAGIQPVIQSPVQPFVSSPVGQFGVLPAITPPIISTFPGPTHTPIGPGVVSRFNGVIVVYPYGSVITPASAFIAGPASVIGPATTIVRPIGPSTVVATPPPSAPATVAPPVVAPPVGPPPDGRRVHVPAGTTRAQVIQQLGEPVTTIVTQDGEMLGFSDGAMIYLQNGVVVMR
jgi:hypothetical protein